MSCPEERVNETTRDGVTQMQIQGLQDIGQSFIDACGHIGRGADMEHAKARMREAVMWATRAISA